MTVPPTVVVTGATGFVGRAVCARLASAGWRVVAWARGGEASLLPGVEMRVIGDLTEVSDFATLLKGVQAVVHLAAKVHVMQPTPEDTAAFRSVNVEITARLAEEAVRAGVERFVYLSSIKVNGEATAPDRPYCSDDPPAPQDDYGRSKAAAEQVLRDISADAPLGVTVLRPPMVYGPGVKANMAALVRLCDTPLPLPAPEGNARSLVAVGNLADAIAVVLAKPDAADRTYLVRDGEDVSTGELMRRLRRALGRPERLVPVSARWTGGLLRLLGRARLAARLCGSLTVDDSPIRRELGWEPPLTLNEALRLMVRERRRILFLVTEDWYFWSHRVSLARAARDAGWEVHVACRVSAHGERIRAEGFALHPLRLRRSGRNPLGELAAIAEITRLYGSVRPDLVHQVAMKPVLYGSLAARLARVPVVLNAMAGMGSVFVSRRLSARLLRPFVMVAFRFLLRRPNQWLVVQNEEDAALFRDRGLVQPDHIRLIPGSGVDTQRFAPSPEPDGDSIIATVVSRMLWSKGIAEAAEAGRLLKERGIPVTVRLVGEPDRENPDAVPIETLETWNREGIVEWLGRREDIPELLASSHIGVLASYREGVPRSLLEAGACARPLITTDAPGCRTLVTHGVNGLKVPPGNAAALADALERLAGDPDLRRSLGREARRCVEATYGDGPVIRAFLDLYDELVGASS